MSKLFETIKLFYYTKFTMKVRKSGYWIQFNSYYS